MNDYDVVVIGGGPAGSVTAALCAQAGSRVAVIERARFPRHKVCGDTLNPRCRPILERVGVWPQINRLPQSPLTGARFFGPGGQQLFVPVKGALAIRRCLFDAALLAHARAQGVEVFEGETAHAISVDGDVSTTTRALRGRFVVGADGRQSIVARQSGLARSRQRSGPVAFQTHLPAPATLDDTVQLHIFPGGYAGVTRVTDVTANLCNVLRSPPVRSPTDSFLEQTAQQNPAFRALRFTAPVEAWASAQPLAGPLNVPVRDRVLLVGDALRVIEPFTGQGMFFALRTGELAAEAIIRNRLDDFPGAVRELYRTLARTNRWLRRLMYQPSLAAATIRAVRRSSWLSDWLAGNVVG